METGLQQRYFEEVLGLSIAPIAPVAIESEALNDVTKALLDKILSTIPGGVIPSGHRLRFVGLGGRIEEGGEVHWLLPKLSEMVGAGPEVVELKKSAWNLLRQFIQENAK